MDLNAELTVEQAAKVLSLPPSVVRSLPSLRASDVEAFLRDSLIRLYREIAVKPTETWEEVAVEQEYPVKEMMESRGNARYIPRRELAGTFNSVRFTIEQISDSGIRVRHGETLLPGEEGRVSFTLASPPKSFTMKARVVWTSIGEDECVSGIRITENVERLAQAVFILRETHVLKPEKKAVKLKPGAEPPPVIRGVSDEDVAAIVRAARKLASEPNEAVRWYNRARFALADEQIRKSAPPHAREREEVLSVWEFLERRVDMQKVACVMSWMRTARVAAT